jgi:hypothetical protein
MVRAVEAALARWILHERDIVQTEMTTTNQFLLEVQTTGAIPTMKIVFSINASTIRMNFGVWLAFAP